MTGDTAGVRRLCLGESQGGNHRKLPLADAVILELGAELELGPTCPVVFSSLIPVEESREGILGRETKPEDARPGVRP